MMKWLNTIRWKNLVIIWISILIVVFPHYDLWRSWILLDEFIYWAIICSSIAAIGNITNDWLDVKQDKENKKKNIFAKPGNRGIGIALILIFGTCAIVGLIFSHLQDVFAWIASSALVLLIGYNTIFKKLPLIGNLVIAVLTGMIFVGIDLIAMSRIIYFEFGVDTKQIEMLGLFAMLTTLIREILKDAEDRRGDIFAGFHTIARYLKDKWIVVLIMLIHLVGCTGIYLFMSTRHNHFYTPFIYYVAWCSIVTFASGVLMIIPHPSRYVRATRIIKAGMLGCLVIYLFLSL